MPWPRNDSDPIEVKRRKLAEQEKFLAEQMSRLKEELEQSGEPPPVINVKPAEPPVWRMEEDPPRRAADPMLARRRNLGRQRQRDMILFFTLLGFFLIVAIIAFWIAYVRNVGPNNGA